MSWTTTRRQARSSDGARRRDTRTTAPGRAVNHGGSTGSRRVRRSRVCPRIGPPILSVYNFTGIADYLDTSRRMAKYFIDNIPEDGVVPWFVAVLSRVRIRPEIDVDARDFNAPVAGRPADTSAAMVATNALLLLSQQETKVNNASGAAYYQSVAQQVSCRLTSADQLSAANARACADPHEHDD